MMLGDIPVLLLAVFKQRKLRHPQKFEHARLDQAQAAAKLHAQRAQAVKHRLVFTVRDNQDHIALFHAHTRADRVFFRVCEEFFIGGAFRIVRQARKRQAAGAVRPDKISELIDLLARQMIGRALRVDGAHAAARVKRAAEHLERTVGKQVGQIGQLHAKAHVGLVGAKAAHRLVIRHT